jgi:isoquinoline 1-oxidoreductase beta subunit
MATVTRRDVAIGGAATLLIPVGIALTSTSSNVPITTLTGGAAAPAPPAALGAYLRIDTSNIVTILVGSTEMGQGIMTGLAQLVAEELMLSWTQVRVEHALASAAWPNPYGNPIFGAQLTGGSTSMRGWYLPMRRAAAIARDMLLAAAAKQAPGAAWSLVPGGKMTNGTLTYLFKDVVATAATLTAPSTAALATTSNVIGQKMSRVDIPEKTTGAAVFGTDVIVPGMVFASVIHCPTSGGTVASAPASASGALAVVNLGDSVGVIATDTWTAMRIAKSLQSKIKWTLPTNLAARDSASIFAVAQGLLTSASAVTHVYETTGAVDPGQALAGAKAKIDATYHLPYLAHGCMEVLSATASVTATSCEIWAATQGQQFCIPTAQAITGLPPSAITVHTTYLGGGLGRKIEQDYIAQAVKLAKAYGRPVKLIWSRTADFQNDKYRPCASIRVQAGVDANNAFNALLYRNVSPSINIQRNTVPGNNPEDTGAVAGAVGLPYGIANRRIEYVPNPADIPLGYWRSVGESYNTFAVESAVDELAKAAGVDPMVFRRTALAGNARALGVLNAVDKLSGWSTTAVPAGNARGVAFLSGFGSYIAMVAQVSLSGGKVKVNKVFCAIDCGIAINPDSIEAQIQGGIIHGLSATLWGEVKFSNGVPNIVNFNNYRVLRMSEQPVVAVTIVSSTAAPGGVGETGVPCVAPAIANALARLNGTRIRQLPFYPGATMSD